ncbi:aromatic-L-amino-acid decarboxylase activity protein [Homalodisca vitripennis]|nr:aromatic-L-amino-acid decarboxylase activity protein [Homalodisca vitripennis]
MHVPGSTMDTEEFRKRGKEMVDYLCEYMETLSCRPVTSTVHPNYLRDLLPQEAPVNPEPWDDIIADLEHKIMPGVEKARSQRYVVENTIRNLIENFDILRVGYSGKKTKLGTLEVRRARRKLRIEKEQKDKER